MHSRLIASTASLCSFRDCWWSFRNSVWRASIRSRSSSALRNASVIDATSCTSSSIFFRSSACSLSTAAFRLATSSFSVAPCRWLGKVLNTSMRNDCNFCCSSAISAALDERISAICPMTVVSDALWSSDTSKSAFCDCRSTASNRLVVCACFSNRAASLPLISASSSLHCVRAFSWHSLSCSSKPRTISFCACRRATFWSDDSLRSSFRKSESSV
mmetsp:Transcript_49196/g.115085  ORF Transcript_49196/g.115085 Transcript_49196/m.115085 type:complete len:216 (+) Transcript_49196:3338-3985(+)